jgi:hypothetical protein
MGDPLRVGAAFPDPPFNGTEAGGGLDVSLMSAVAELLGRAVEFIPYTGKLAEIRSAWLGDGRLDQATEHASR